MRAFAKNLIIPTPEDSKSAIEILKALFPHASEQMHVQLEFVSSTGMSNSARIPPLALKLLVDILRQMASGDALSILPIRKDVTTQEAAEILNVSRPFVIGLLQKNEIPFRMVGSHRRIPLAALLEYKRRTDAIRDETLDFLTAEAQELKLGY